MKISIHMPAYNAEATIGSALKSLLRQRDAGDLDIIVVDDGSTDQTRDVIGALAATAPEIRLICATHGGISCARNTALRAMAPDTDLVGFLDADDLSPAGRLARDAAVLAADPSIQFVYSKIRFFDEEDSELLAPSATSHAVDGWIGQLGQALFRREVLERAGRFDETLRQSEDLDLWLRIFAEEPKYAILEDVGVFYRKNHGSITENRRQFRQELMRTIFRHRKRQPRLGELGLPRGFISADHMAELKTWVR
jgi:glycosyltransferase involved in cell wall biosynthesis